MKEHLFFVSTGRTGTHFLKHFFDRHVPNTIAFHEPKPAFKRRGYELVNRSYTLYEKYYFKSFRMARCIGVDVDIYVEANNCLFSSIPLIRDTFSPSKIVHIIRDGRKVVQSYMNSLKRYAKDPRANKQLTPGHFPDDRFTAQWEQMNPIEKTAWFWLRVNEVIEMSNPDMTVRFEDLFTPPHSPLVEIIERLPDTSISPLTVENAFQQKSHASFLNFIPEWQDWPPQWKTQFKNICGEKMKEYGYEMSLGDLTR